MSCSSYLVFRHPVTCIVSAPSNSGKSSLVFDIIHNSARLVEGGPFDACFVIYKSWQPLYETVKKKVPNVFFFEKQIDNHQDYLRYKRAVIVIDDGLCSENQEFVVDLFCRLGHHLSISVFLLCHTIYDSSTLRICHRNAKALIIFACPRDQSTLRTLVYQMYPDRKKARLLFKTLEKEFEKPFSYVVFDFDPRCPIQERIKCNILCERETTPIVLKFSR